MKKRVIQPMFLLLLAAFLMVPTMQSCKSKAAAQKAPDDEVKIQTYCSGPEYFTQPGFFRANSVGESEDQVMSKKKAMNTAKTELAGSIETIIKSVTDNYSSSYVANNAEDFKQRFESLSREVVNQKLTGITLMCEQVVQNPKTKKYKTYVAIQLSGDEILNAMKDKVSKDTKLEMDFQYDKFKKELDKEMENYKKEN